MMGKRVSACFQRLKFASWFACVRMYSFGISYTSFAMCLRRDDAMAGLEMSFG
jgi:hypothetical protein